MNHRSVVVPPMRKLSGRDRVPKSKILKAALDLFSSRGYEETKMSEIARRVGLSVGALYLRFKGKEELCLELIRDQTKDFDEIARKFSESEEDPFQSLKGYIEFCIGYSFQKKQLLSLFVREHRLPFICPLRKRFLNSQLGIIRSILSAGAEKGVFRRMDNDDTALMIFAGIRGAVLLKIIFETGDAKTISDSLFRLIDQGIRRHPD
jgi:AcrR family transcriptional regulator